MPKGSFAHLILATTDLKNAKETVRGIAASLGFKAHGRMRGSTGFVVSGIRGSSLMALLGQMIPFGEFFGWFSRTAVQAKCRSVASRSLGRRFVTTVNAVFAP